MLEKENVDEASEVDKVKNMLLEIKKIDLIRMNLQLSMESEDYQIIKKIMALGKKQECELTIESSKQLVTKIKETLVKVAATLWSNNSKSTTWNVELN